ncbi:MAG: hypothetical protein AAFO04_07045 [Cyanobacteria bacterium J06592_8]
MKRIPIIIATVLSLFWTALRAEEPCQAYVIETTETPTEVNNCPMTTETFSIRGTFVNANWKVATGGWEAGAYIYKRVNRQDGSSIRVYDFDVGGTTSRPKYRFTEGNQTHVVTFQYSDPNTIRLEVFQNQQLISNELLERTSDELNLP